MRTFFLLFCIIPSFAFSQKIENLKAEVRGEKVIVNYDLDLGTTGKYKISLYSSHNNFETAVNRVTGDVGDGVTAGKNKQLVWNSKAELGNFKGKLIFEVRAELILPLAFIASTHSARRGKVLSIKWKGGDTRKGVKLELLDGGVVTSSLGTTPNRAAFDWTIPANQKIGNDYQVRITNANEIVTTQPFSIKHRIPLLVKLIPLVIVAVVLLPHFKSNSTTDNALPRPPDLGLANN
jgi:hypothetical protein